ncbi:arginine repressor [Boudabousia marimammalium]|uniref:Arginine repressor n=1 Tax=Boudabousia marimammalium TaxID=156892 RepID=A0A1Q5PNW5_9ACTO|nr:hypothetical protein [Boudabousia marimammalium]OKL49199.1 hypothetical protein BM477_04175 [Boudabousia marimammalium]
MSELYPLTKTGRLRAIRDFLSTTRVSSQVQLVDRLAQLGFSVTQTTVSRDLVELRAARVRDAHGDLVYRISPIAVDKEVAELSERLFRLAAELIVSTGQAVNQVVLRTHAGAAQFLASGLDEAEDPRVLGSIAGDDTVLVICQSEESARAFQEELMKVLSSFTGTSD